MHDCPWYSSNVRTSVRGSVLDGTPERGNRRNYHVQDEREFSWSIRQWDHVNVKGNEMVFHLGLKRLILFYVHDFE